MKYVPAIGPTPVMVAAAALIAFLILYTTAGVLLARNIWNLATWASKHDPLHRKPAAFRAGGFVMAVSGPPLLAFVVVEILWSR